MFISGRISKKEDCPRVYVGGLGKIGVTLLRVVPVVVERGP